MNSVEPVTTPVVTAPSLPADKVERVRKLVSGHGLWCPLPSPTNHLFAQRRQEEFARLARSAWPLLIFMIALVGIGGVQFFENELRGGDARFWWGGLVAESCLILLVTFLMRFQAVQRHYQSLIVVSGSFTLGLLLFATLILADPRLMRAASYVGLLTITIQVLALRLSLPAAALCCGSGILVASLAGYAMNVSADWALFYWFSVGGLIVTLFIGAVHERQERISFLRGLLLEHESAERERLNAILARHASEDQLTGLPNRRHFSEALVREWDRSSRTQKPLALLFMDVDYFKRFNDSLGHLAGDDCLAAIGEAIQSAVLRPADLAARYGGEEFVVLLPETEVEGAMEVAQRVLEAVDARAIRHPASSVAPHVTMSIGVAVLVPQGNRPQLLVDAADAALYEAKGRGRHQVVLAH